MPAVFWEYVLSPTRSGVLTALDFVLRNSSASSGSASGSGSGGSGGSGGGGGGVFDRLTAQQRSALRLYIATTEPIKLMTGTFCAVCSVQCAVCVC